MSVEDSVFKDEIIERMFAEHDALKQQKFREAEQRLRRYLVAGETLQQIYNTEDTCVCNLLYREDLIETNCFINIASVINNTESVRNLLDVTPDIIHDFSLLPQGQLTEDDILEESKGQSFDLSTS